MDPPLYYYYLHKIMNKKEQNWIVCKYGRRTKLECFCWSPSSKAISSPVHRAYANLFGKSCVTQGSSNFHTDLKFGIVWTFLNKDVCFFLE